MVDAAKLAGVKLFIWSSLVSIDKISHGTLACFPFDVKAEIAEYLKASGVPYATVLPGWFFKNLYWGPNMPVKQVDGTYVLTMPVPASTKTPIIDVELDYGRYVRAVIEKPWLGAGSEIVTGTMISFEDQMAQLSECKCPVALWQRLLIVLSTRHREDIQVQAGRLRPVPDTGLGTDGRRGLQHDDVFLEVWLCVYSLTSMKSSLSLFGEQFTGAKTWRLVIE